MDTTVTSTSRILADGMGSDKQLKVSIVTERYVQRGHTSSDLYIPCHSHARHVSKGKDDKSHKVQS